MRETLRNAAIRSRLDRFIPAHAGNSTILHPRATMTCRKPVHPRACGELGRHQVHRRACGELIPCPSFAHVSSGSSPRMRGTRSTTARSASGSSPASVHPRACGELCTATTARIISNGSSPRMRGTPLSPRLDRWQIRFIPAHAGNSVRPVFHASQPSVHPRACGELTSADYAETTNTGSSPRMRGTPSLILFFRSVLAVHPRACGELMREDIEKAKQFGSSPRMRGTHEKEREAMALKRFIPAHAGNSAAHATASASTRFIPAHAGNSIWKYTRSSISCRFIPAHAGNSRDTAQSGWRIASRPGSSPRMRGTQRQQRAQVYKQRFIPAHAGNSHHVDRDGQLQKERFIPAHAGNSRSGSSQL